MTKTEILIICVNYKCSSTTSAFVHKLISLAKDKNLPNIRLIIVNNDESPLNDISVNSDYPNVTINILESGENLGYFGGASFGFSEYLRESCGHIPEYLIISNVDLTFSKNFFLLLVERDFSINDKTMVIAPRIVSLLSGKEQNPFLVTRIRKNRLRFYKYLYSSSLLSASYSLLGHVKSAALARIQRHYKVAKYRDLSTIYAPHGACIIFKRRYFECGGGLSYPSFLFLEEIWVAEEVRRLNGKVLYTNALEVYHDEHITTGFIVSKKLTSYYRDSVDFIMNRYF